MSFFFFFHLFPFNVKEYTNEAFGRGRASRILLNRVLFSWGTVVQGRRRAPSWRALVLWAWPRLVQGGRVHVRAEMLTGGRSGSPACTRSLRTSCSSPALFIMGVVICLYVVMEWRLVLLCAFVLSAQQPFNERKPVSHQCLQRKLLKCISLCLWS